MNRRSLPVLALTGILALGACGSVPSTAGSGGTANGAVAADAVRVGDVVDLVELSARSNEAIRAQRTAHISMTTGDGPVLDGDVDYLEGSPAMSMTMREGDDTMDAVYVDEVMYVGGSTMADVSGGKPWVRIDPDADDMMSRMLGSMLDDLRSSMSNPATQLEPFEGLEATVSEVDGDVVTYAVEVSKDQLAEVLRKQAGAPVGGVSEEALDQLPGGVTYELTIDGQDLPSTMTMDIADQTVTIEYSAWGEPVDITAPPANQVGTFQAPVG